MCAVSSLLTSSADAAGKKKTKKKKAHVAAAAPAEPPAPEPEPAPAPAKSESAPPPPAADPWKATARTELGPPGDKPQEDRTGTRDAAKKPISIAPLLGYGSEGFRFGFGIRVGYTLPIGTSGNGVYFGGAFMYHLGYSVDAGAFGSSSFSAFYPSGEVGYELRPIDRLSIRPYGGLGVVFVKVSSTMTTLFSDSKKEVSSTYSAFALYPGCTVNYDIPSTSIFVGGDARLLIPLEGAGASFGVFASGGFRF
jgi:hypothetical protein